MRNDSSLTSDASVLSSQFSVLGFQFSVCFVENITYLLMSCGLQATDGVRQADVWAKVAAPGDPPPIPVSPADPDELTFLLLSTRTPAAGAAG